MFITAAKSSPHQMNGTGERCSVEELKCSYLYEIIEHSQIHSTRNMMFIAIEHRLNASSELHASKRETLFVCAKKTASANE